MRYIYQLLWTRTKMDVTLLRRRTFQKPSQMAKPWRKLCVKWAKLGRGAGWLFHRGTYLADTFGGGGRGISGSRITSRCCQVGVACGDAG